jgi:hypothetical protein
MATNSQFPDIALRHLQRQLAWSLAVAVLALLGVVALAIAWWASSHGNRDDVLRTHGIIVEDTQGHDRILIGEAAIAATKSTSSYGRTNSIVFLNRTGGYHLALGQTPEPVVNGKAVGARIGNGDNYGVTLYDTHGSERGGMGFIGGASRAAIVLDRPWPSADAIGLIVDDKTGFAGLGVNYAKGGQSGFEVGTQGNAVSMTLRDPQGQERASVRVDGPAKPAWQFNGAATATSSSSP